jgi:hypothetical protein
MYVYVLVCDVTVVLENKLVFTSYFFPFFHLSPFYVLLFSFIMEITHTRGPKRQETLGPTSPIQDWEVERATVSSLISWLFIFPCELINVFFLRFWSS